MLVLAVPLFLYRWIWVSRHSGRIEKETEAEQLVEQFHRQYNARDFEAICRAAYKRGEYPILKEDWRLAVEDSRNHGGAFKNILRSDIRAFTEPPSVRADIVSSFEKGEMREIFTMNDFDGPLRIVTYGRVFTP